MLKGLVPGLLEIGKIKIGVKGEMIESKGGVSFRPPKKLDHFLITTNQRNDKGDFELDTNLMTSLLENSMSQKNSEGHLVGIPVRLLYNDIDLNFGCRYVSYSGSVVAWYSNDGETMHTRDGRSIPFNPELVSPAYQGPDKGKVSGILSLIIDGASSFGGCWKFRTTSMNTVKSIYGSMAALKHAAGGRLAFMPLLLTVVPKATTIPDTGKPTTVHIVSLIFPGSVEQLQQKAIGMARNDAQFLIEMATVEEEAKKIMEAGSNTAPEEDIDFINEFMPEEAIKAAAEASKKVEPVKETDKEPEPVKESDTEPEPTEEPDTEPAAEIGVAADDLASYNLVHERAKQLLANKPGDAKDFIKWVSDKLELDVLAVASVQQFVEVVGQYQEAITTEHVPPTASKEKDLKDSDPTSLVNWVNMGTNFRPYVEKHLEAFQNASNEVKVKLVNKWSRLQHTADKICPVVAGRKQKELDASLEEDEKPEDKSNPSGAATNATKVKIVVAKKALGILNMDIWNKLLEPYDVASANDLTEEQAQAFVKHLQELRDNPELIPT